MFYAFGAAAALAAVYVILFLRAELPKKGTLEWIDLYEKPAWHFPSTGTDGYDLLWGLIPGVLYGGVWCVVLWFDRLMLQPAVVPITMIVCAVVTGICVYLTARRLGCRVVTALCASALLLTAADLPPMLLPAAGIALTLLLWMQRGYGAVSWLCLAGVAALTALGTLVDVTYILLAAPLLLALIGVMLRRWQSGECGFWRLAATLGCAVGVFAVLTVVFAALTPQWALPACLADPQFYARAFGRLAPELWLDVSLPQLLWFDLPQAAVLLAGLPLLLAGAIRRHDRAALYLLLWDLAAVCLWLTTALDLLSVFAALTCAWCARRMLRRGHNALAVLTLAVPAAATVFLTVIQLLNMGG